MTREIRSRKIQVNGAIVFPGLPTCHVITTLLSATNYIWGTINTVQEER